ncbi:MAG: type II secretion system major pseudopilin GspG [Desulfosudaceae bacterium]
MIFKNARMGAFKTTRSQAGFTLIELMVVLVILGILAVTIAPQILDRPEKARRLKAKMTIETLGTALDLYKLDMGHYPSTSQGLEALVSKPESGNVSDNWREGGYLKKDTIPKDPWGNEYIYLCPGVHGEYDIVSYGADGVSGGEGNNADIKSWELE